MHSPWPCRAAVVATWDRIPGPMQRTNAQRIVGQRLANGPGELLLGAAHVSELARLDARVQVAALLLVAKAEPICGAQHGTISAAVSAGLIPTAAACWDAIAAGGCNTASLATTQTAWPRVLCGSAGGRARLLSTWWTQFSGCWCRQVYTEQCLSLMFELQPLPASWLQLGGLQQAHLETCAGSRLKRTPFQSCAGPQHA